MFGSLQNLSSAYRISIVPNDPKWEVSNIKNDITLVLGLLMYIKLYTYLPNTDHTLFRWYTRAQSARVEQRMHPEHLFLSLDHPGP